MHQWTHASLSMRLPNSPTASHELTNTQHCSRHASMVITWLRPLTYTVSQQSHTHTHTHTYRHASSLLHFLIWITFLADTKWIWMLVTFNKTKRSLNSHRVMCKFLHKNVACCVGTWWGYVMANMAMVKNGSLLVKLKKCAGLTD